MCRLFGFRSIIQSQVHTSLVAGKDSFLSWSQEHPDGWGLAYYVAGAPHIIKSESTAINDALFTKVSGKASSETVVAHLRKATLGTIDLANTHPFQFGPWIFAHNGNIKNFDTYRDKLYDLVPPGLSRFILGETDSELIFFVMLSEISKLANIVDSDISLSLVIDGIKVALSKIGSIIGEFSHIDGPPSETYLTFILSNGGLMVAHQGGKSLLYSTYKKRCPERDSCASFGDVCENTSTNGDINHLLISSQKIVGDNVWLTLRPGEMVAVDRQMKLHKGGAFR